MKSQRISKIIATLLLLTQVVCILPAEELIQERNYGRARLEQYLSRAERERNAQDYERIAEEGLMLAMIEWESANTYLRETDYTTYEAEKAKVKTEYEKITAREYALWYVNKKLEDEAAVKSSELAKELSKKAEEYREKYKESAYAILRSLTDNYSNLDNDNEQAILFGATVNAVINKGINVGLIYADYFYVEAISRLKGNRELFWYSELKTDK